MALIDPFNKYKPIPLSRKRRTKLPSFRTVALLALVISGVVTSKTYLLNQYNYFKGLKYWKSGDLELSRMEFTKVLDRNPGNAKAIDGLGLVDLKAGNLDKAREKYTQALNAGLTYSQRFDHLKFGQSFVDQGLYNQAELEIQHAQELQPNNPEVYIALGTTERALGEVVNGEKAYEKALALDPKNKKIQVLLEQAREEKDRGSIYYIYDRNGVPLALQWIKNGAKGYPMGKEFAHLIGYNDPAPANNRGSAGLEQIYQKDFPGTSFTSQSTAASSACFPKPWVGKKAPSWF